MRRRSPASELSGLERAGNAVRAFYGTGADDPARARSPLEPRQGIPIALSYNYGSPRKKDSLPTSLLPLWLSRRRAVRQPPSEDCKTMCTSATVALAGPRSASLPPFMHAGHQEPTSETAHVHSMCTVTAQSGTLLAPFAFRSVAPAVLGGAEQEHGESSPRPPRDDPDPRKPRRPLVASYRPLLTLAMTSAPGRQV